MSWIYVVGPVPSSTSPICSATSQTLAKWEARSSVVSTARREHTEAQNSRTAQPMQMSPRKQGLPSGFWNVIFHILW